MGDHKLREANGDGEKLKAVSSHIVEVVDALIFGDDAGKVLSERIEAAYTKLSDRATAEQSLILGVVQAVSTYALSGERSFVLVVLTAQRISREDFERQQRIAQFGPGGPRR